MKCRPANLKRHVRDRHGSSDKKNTRTYTLEQVDWIRYYHADLATHWANLVQLYNNKWEPKRTFECLRSRYYRDNQQVPQFESNQLVVDSNRNPIWKGIQERGKEHFCLSIIRPERALRWDWVKGEHKVEIVNRLKNDPSEMERFIQLNKTMKGMSVKLPDWVVESLMPYGLK